MDQLKKLFATLSLTQKIGLAAVVLMMGAGIPLFTKWQHEGSFKPLVTGMAPEDAGEIVTKLKETGVEHRLSENGTSILVPADKVDEVRLELASEGLPKTGRIGYELFDKTNLSLTDYSEHINYLRALEGELEKTIKSVSAIEQARVHVVLPKDSVFIDSREPAKASVLVRVRPGVRLLAQNVTAIANLVAGAVEGLSPDAVSIVDMQGNLLSKRRKPSVDASETAENALEYKDQVEKDLTAKVEATLEPLLGEGKFRIGINADCDFSTSEQTDEVYDPSRSVMSTSQKTEDLSQGASSSGVPGTPSNLPRSQIKAQAAAGAGPGGTSVSRRTENVAFETSRTVRQVKTPRGIVKKISAALLIDQDTEWQGSGKQRRRVLVPPSAERSKAIHDVVAGVLGISTERGDQLIVETLPFEQTRNPEEMSSSSDMPLSEHKTGIAELLDHKVLIGGGVGLVLVVLVAGFLLRSPKRGAEGAQLQDRAVILPGKAEGRRPDPIAPFTGVAGLSNAESERVASQETARELEESSLALQLPEMTSHSKILLDRLRKSVHHDPDSAANVIRGWLAEE